MHQLLNTPESLGAPTVMHAHAWRRHTETSPQDPPATTCPSLHVELMVQGPMRSAPSLKVDRTINASEPIAPHYNPVSTNGAITGKVIRLPVRHPPDAKNPCRVPTVMPAGGDSSSHTAIRIGITESYMPTPPPPPPNLT